MTHQLAFGTLPQVQQHRALLLYDNRLLGRAGANVVADSTAEEGDYAAANLLTENQFDRWRSGSLAVVSAQPTPEVVLTWTLGRPAAVDWVSYDRSNSLLPWRADLYQGVPGAGGALLATTGWTSPVVRSAPDDWLFDDFPWQTGPTDERIAQLAADARLASFAHLAAPVYGVTHVVLRFDASEGVNGTFDYLQVALPFAGLAFQPHINITRGAKLVPVVRSAVRRTQGGAVMGVRRRPGVEAELVLDHLTDGEGFELLSRLMLDGQAELARVFYYQETAAEHRRHFYDGQAFTGTVTAFEGLTLEDEEGELAGVLVPKSVKGVKIQSTE
jgi:hypothetical protein